VRVTVLFFGILKDITGRPAEHMELPPDANVGTVFDRCAEAFPGLRPMERSVMLARNQRFAAVSEPVADGDEIALLPPVSGGS
jgi:molybdopterin converting factor small subunit